MTLISYETRTVYPSAGSVLGKTVVPSIRLNWPFNGSSKTKFLLERCGCRLAVKVNVCKRNRPNQLVKQMVDLIYGKGGIGRPFPKLPTNLSTSTLITTLTFLSSDHEQAQLIIKLNSKAMRPS